MRFLLVILALFSTATFAENWHPTYKTKRSWVTEHLRTGGRLQEITGLDKSLDKAEIPSVGVEIPDDLPASLDWRDVGLQPIRNQGRCGSCWAFATTAVLESLAIIANPAGHRWDLAEQAVLSCSGSGSCGGGYFGAFNYMKSGLADESQFPYTASNQRCKKGLEGKEKLASWAYVNKPTTASIKAALKEYGPVAVTVNGNFANYGSGVYNNCSSGGTNHMVSLEGWVDDPAFKSNGGGYWIMRNSWGANWGEKGYMKIVYQSKSGMKCNRIGEVAAFASLSDTLN